MIAFVVGAVAADTHALFDFHQVQYDVLCVYSSSPHNIFHFYYYCYYSRLIPRSLFGTLVFTAGELSAHIAYVCIYIKTHGRNEWKHLVFCCCCWSFDYGDYDYDYTTIKTRTMNWREKNASRGCGLIASFACEWNRCEAVLSMWSYVSFRLALVSPCEAYVRLCVCEKIILFVCS